MNRKAMIKVFVFAMCLITFFYMNTMSGQSMITTVKSSPNQLSSMARITFNPNVSVMDLNYENVTLEQVNQMAKLDEVQEVEYSLDFVLYNQELKNPYENESTLFNQFFVRGVSSCHFALLKEGVILLKEGRSFNEEELMKTNFEKVPVLVSEEFANINHLTIGSNFSLDNNVYFIPFTNEDLDLANLYVDSNLVTKETYEFKVIGIYTQNETDEVPELSNEIFVPETFVEYARNFYFDNAHNAHKKVYQNKSWWAEIEKNYQFNLLNQKAITALFILKDGANWDDFEAKANEIIMPSHQVKKIRTIKGVWDY